MNKYLKISLVSAALSIALGSILYIVTEFFDYGIGFGQRLFEMLPTGFCWSTGELLLSCYSSMMAVDNAAFFIPYYGMILTALVSAVTGLIAACQVLKAHDKWWHLITIYAAINALLVFIFAPSL